MTELKILGHALFNDLGMAGSGFEDMANLVYFSSGLARGILRGQIEMELTRPICSDDNTFALWSQVFNAEENVNLGNTSHGDASVLLESVLFDNSMSVDQAKMWIHDSKYLESVRFDVDGAEEVAMVDVCSSWLSEQGASPKSVMISRFKSVFEKVHKSNTSSLLLYTIGFNVPPVIYICNG